MNFAARNELLARMGFPTYEAYLASPLWESIRVRVYEAKGRTCLRCRQADAVEVHHTRYDEPTLRGDTLNYLVPVCRDCHEGEHGIGGKDRVGPAPPKASRSRPRKKKQSPPPVITFTTDCTSCGMPTLTAGLCPRCASAKRMAQAEADAARRKAKRMERRNQPRCECGNMKRPGDVVCRACKLKK